MSYDKISRALLGISIFICGGLRIYLKLTAVDPSTGFYEGGGIIATLFLPLAGVFAAAMFLLGLLQHTYDPSLYCSLPMRLFALLTAVAAVPFAYEGVLSHLAALERMQLFHYGPVQLVLHLFIWGVGLLCTTIAPLVSVWFFLQTALRARGVYRFPAVSGALALFPLLWQAAYLLRTFMAYTAIRSVSDQMLSVLSMIFCIPFLLANGRVLGGIDAEKGLRQLVTFGRPFALLAICSAISTIAGALSGRMVEAAPSLFAGIFYLTLGCYAAAITWDCQPE
ncbi:MAG: hypothetical protein HFG20_02655 [Anaerotruncus sp.]|nr:hypothetical protein [Anaerotruncus sp.]